MKKLLLTVVVALSTLALLQFMVVTTYDGDQTENIDKLTANLGFGYTVMDGITVGVVRKFHRRFPEKMFLMYGVDMI